MNRILLLVLLLAVAVAALIEASRLTRPAKILPAPPGAPPPVVTTLPPSSDGGPLSGLETRQIDPAAALRLGTLHP